MNAPSKRLAHCAMTSALSILLMLVLGFTGVGTYAAPLLASLLLVPVQERWGTGTALTVWLAVGLLALLLVTDRELSVVYLTVFGWYPAARPPLLRLPNPFSLLLRLGIFNTAVVLTYAALLTVMGMGETLGGPLAIALMLLMGNISFLLEDLVLIPRAVWMSGKRFH